MNILSMLISHSGDIVRAIAEIIGGVSLLVALLPASSAKNQLVAILGRISAMTHSDSPGTVKLPFARMPLPKKK